MIIGVRIDRLIGKRENFRTDYFNIFLNIKEKYY